MMRPMGRSMPPRVCSRFISSMSTNGGGRHSEIHRRLKPGAPFVAAHSSFPQADAERTRWLSRYAAYAIASGADPDQANNARAAVDANLNLFSPEQDAQILREAGFRDVELFYAAFTWRGWIANA